MRLKMAELADDIQGEIYGLQWDGVDRASDAQRGGFARGVPPTDGGGGRQVMNTDARSQARGGSVGDRDVPWISE